MIPPERAPGRITRSVAYIPAAAVALYIKQQRGRLAKSASGLSLSCKETLAPYFDRETLDRTRIFISERLPLPDLPFSTVLGLCGVHVPRPSTVAAITFDDVIAARATMPPALLFHELVHVVQYRLLGVDGFARRYVEGFLLERSYERIPLEQCAFALEERFIRRQPVDVKAEVGSWLERDPTAPADSPWTSSS